MIRVGLSWLFFFYLLVFLAVISAAWIASGRGRRMSERRSLRGRNQCRSCGCVYRLGGMKPPSRCPRCGALNERQRVQIF